MEDPHLTDHDFENLLHQIVGNMRADGIAAHPCLKQGSIEQVEALPGISIIGILMETLFTRTVGPLPISRGLTRVGAHFAPGDAGGWMERHETRRSP
jgi:hypothetical protein